MGGQFRAETGGQFAPETGGSVWSGWRGSISADTPKKSWDSKYFILILINFCSLNSARCQEGFGNNWILGYDSALPNISGSLLNFGNDSIHITGINKNMELEGSNTSISNDEGILQFYSNGCYINGADNELIPNGDSIGLGVLATSYCKTGGSPLNQSIISLPIGENKKIYYLFYPDLEEPYRNSNEHYFPLAPLHLYYSKIDMSKNAGKGDVVAKNSIIISDTLARGMIQATRSNNKDAWWIIMPESHSNCYYIIRLSYNGVDTIMHQCLGEEWDDSDLTGQAVFSPNRKKYVRFNYFNGLNIYDFDDFTGKLSNPKNIRIPRDTFYYSGVAISPNSRFIYATTNDQLFQLDLNSTESLLNYQLIGELTTPQDIEYKTNFNLTALGVDGKIYIGGTNTHNYLHIIQDPNCFGKNCNLKQYALKMPSWNVYGMPNQPNYIDWGIISSCDTTLSIEPGIDNRLVAKFYPNPFSDYIEIELSELSQLIILDIFGRQVYRNELCKNRVQLPLDNLNKGIYYYIIKKGNNILQQGKLIKF